MAVLLLVLTFKATVFSKNLDSSFLLENLQAQLLDSTEDSFLNGGSQLILSSAVLASNNSPLENPSDLVLVQGDSLKAVSSPSMVFSQTLGMNTESSAGAILRREIIEYTVKSGDTVSSVAEEFDISLNTLLWANNLTSKSKLKDGQTLIILPISGVLHYVKKGETLSQIAKIYKSDTSKIVAFNDLASEDDIFIGDIVIVPDGVLPAPTKKQQKIASSSPLNKVALPSSYFIAPLASPYIVSQGLHWYNAVDLTHLGGNSCGRPVFAAAAGTITRAKAGGWNAGAGNNIAILHPNQVVTAYYHLGGVLVGSGQTVSAGEQIGTIGNTGKTTGCHLHFEVRGAANPFAR